MDARFEGRAPYSKTALDIFEGEWLSELPGYRYGTAALFEDGRIIAFNKEIGGFAGRRVLELGPLDGGHTYMMSNLGASEIVSIEANKQAFLRCLVVKEVYNVRARFLCGDFDKYLAERPPRFDVILASGVLYHQAEPLRLIENMTKAADTICVWTHYYDRAAIAGNERTAPYFDAPEVVDFGGRDVTVCRQTYVDAIASFAGGTERHSTWITKDGFADAFDALGWTMRVLHEHPDHPHGPAFAFVAQRRGA